MAGELATLNDMLPVLVIETRRRRVWLACIFAVIALIALAIGAMWPKKYESSTAILVQESNIITPLMEGRAVATGVANRAAIAREVVLSDKVMEQLLVVGGWAATEPSPLERARIIDSIKGRTQVSGLRDNLIRISYSDSSPERSYKITQRMAQLFIEESLAAKLHESRDAFEFIDSQVKAYHAKLTDAEAALKVYRENNADARPGSGADTNARISSLRSTVEQAHMALTGLNSTENALESQLAGESEITAVQTRKGQISAQLAQLQSQLATLLLTYTDEYPDVVRIRHQMSDLQRQLQAEDQREQAAKLAGAPRSLDDTVQFNPLYQDLRSQLAATRREIAATGARLSASNQLLESELERSRRIAASESALAQLTRDYEVNRDVYQDLLKRRENARVSMNLDKEHQGLTFRIQDPAVLPLQPSGVRFLHFAMVGLALAFAVPLGLLVALARLDPRARSARDIDRLGLPVLASVPVYATSHDRTRQRLRSLVVALLVIGVFVAYAIVAWLKLQKVL